MVNVTVFSGPTATKLPVFSQPFSEVGFNAFPSCGNPEFARAAPLQSAARSKLSIHYLRGAEFPFNVFSTRAPLMYIVMNV